jgi:hypothetical protein
MPDSSLDGAAWSLAVSSGCVAEDLVDNAPQPINCTVAKRTVKTTNIRVKNRTIYLLLLFTLEKKQGIKLNAKLTGNS